MRKLIVSLIREANENGARLIPACNVAGISKRTYERWTKEVDVLPDRRRTAIRPIPANKLSEQERKIVIDTVNLPEYSSMSPLEIVPKLADKGEYIASESTIYRILRENKQLKHRGRNKEPKSKTPTTHIANAPNEVWTWDITWLHRKDVRGIYYKLYMIMDIFSRKIVGYEVWEEENAIHSQTLIKRTLLKESICGKPLVLHSDNGGPMKASSFLGTLEKLGVQSSFSRPRVSNDNPYSESLFKTLKYIPKYPTSGFESLDHAREWTSKFVHWYNEVHLHSGINYVTPGSRHRGEDIEILKKRKEVYARARLKHPERWSGDTKNWKYQATVALNPTDEDKIMIKQESYQKNQIYA